MNGGLKVVSVFFTEEYLKIFLIDNDKVIPGNLVIYLYDFNIIFKF